MLQKVTIQRQRRQEQDIYIYMLISVQLIMPLIIMSVSSHPHGGTADKNNQLNRTLTPHKYTNLLYLYSSCFCADTQR